MLEIDMDRSAQVDMAVEAQLAAFPLPGVAEHVKVTPSWGAKFDKVVVRVYNHETGERVQSVVKAGGSS